jgi:hypothetical protein
LAVIECRIVTGLPAMMTNRATTLRPTAGDSGAPLDLASTVGTAVVLISSEATLPHPCSELDPRRQILRYDHDHLNTNKVASSSELKQK